MLWELNEEPGPSWEGMGPALQDRKSRGSRVLQLRGCVMPPSSPTFFFFLLAGPLLHNMAKSSKEGLFQTCFPYQREDNPTTSLLQGLVSSAPPTDERL